MVTAGPSAAGRGTVLTARAVAETVTDPELPMLTLADLGVLREVTEAGGTVTISITPTYTGCPAMDAMRDDLVRALRGAGFPDVEVRTRAAPGLEHRLDQRGRPPQAGRGGDRAAGQSPGCSPGRADPADAAAASRSGALPALRIRADQADFVASARPRAGHCTAARPARSRSSTSRRSEPRDRQHCDLRRRRQRQAVLTR